jgi:hypothetical protein
MTISRILSVLRTEEKKKIQSPNVDDLGNWNILRS